MGRAPPTEPDLCSLGFGVWGGASGAGWKGVTPVESQGCQPRGRQAMSGHTSVVSAGEVTPCPCRVRWPACGLLRLAALARGWWLLRGPLNASWLAWPFQEGIREPQHGLEPLCRISPGRCGARVGATSTRPSACLLCVRLPWPATQPRVSPVVESWSVLDRALPAPFHLGHACDHSCWGPEAGVGRVGVGPPVPGPRRSLGFAGGCTATPESWAGWPCAIVGQEPELAAAQGTAAARPLASEHPDPPSPARPLSSWPPAQVSEGEGGHSWGLGPPAPPRAPPSPEVGRWGGWAAEHSVLSPGGPEWGAPIPAGGALPRSCPPHHVLLLSP